MANSIDDFLTKIAEKRTLDKDDLETAIKEGAIRKKDVDKLMAEINELTSAIGEFINEKNIRADIALSALSSLTRYYILATAQVDFDLGLLSAQSMQREWNRTVAILEKEKGNTSGFGLN